MSTTTQTSAPAVAQHTPGPWGLEETQSGMTPWLVIARHESRAQGDDYHPVAVIPDDFTPATRDANARLIAAAPELLAALQSLVETSWTDVDDGEDPLKTYSLFVRKAARAAISKAEGAS